MRCSLDELYNGRSAKLQLTKNVICKECDGKGGKGDAVRKCDSCRGQGVKMVVRQLGPAMIQQMQVTCPECKGEGEIIREKDRCKTCRGAKVVSEKKVLEVHIDKGMRGGQRVVFQGEADQQPGVVPGDIVIVIQEKPHDIFERDGDDLIMLKKIQLVEALCGVQFLVKHLDNREILVKSKPSEIIKPGDIRCIKNEGMPHYRSPFDKGNLFIKFEIIFPSNGKLQHNEKVLLERILPPREALPRYNEAEVEEAVLSYVDPRESKEDGRSRRAREAYDNDDDDDDDVPRSGVQCAHQQYLSGSICV
eukprot:TRINITY_DN5461_c0_g1_i2.p1 TRINITY_DN5461_c0_g1~~TRINITY_DN5461_c0_g1_i2.p1  ORF type:complete len:306 (-),score=67.04 TRINITY_DN5461_c0_g1_i2:57-974(-)